MEKFKLSLPVTILLTGLILGGFYYASQVSKQKSIERQQQIDLQEKQAELQVKTGADQAKAEKDKAENEIKIEQTKVKLDAINETQQMTEPQKRQVEVNTKSDSFIVTYDENGNALTWAVLDRMAIILSDTLDTYTTSLISIQEKQDNLNETLNSSYKTLVNISNPQYRTQLQTLINYEESYVTAGENLIGLLTDLIKNYRGLFNVIEKREPQLYLYYNGEVDKLESRKKNIIDDYTNKSNAQVNYAKSMMTQ